MNPRVPGARVLGVLILALLPGVALPAGAADAPADSTAWPLGPRGETPVVFTATVREIRPRVFTFPSSGRTREANTVKVRVASMILGDSLAAATLVCGNRIVLDEGGVPVSVAEEPGSPWFRPDDHLLIVGFERTGDSPFKGTLDAPWVRFLPDGPLEATGRVWRQGKADFGPLLEAKRRGEPVPVDELPNLVNRVMVEEDRLLGELSEAIREFYRTAGKRGRD